MKLADSHSFFFLQKYMKLLVEKALHSYIYKEDRITFYDFTEVMKTKLGKKKRVKFHIYL